MDLSILTVKGTKSFKRSLSLERIVDTKCYTIKSSKVKSNLLLVLYYQVLLGN